MKCASDSHAWPQELRIYETPVATRERAPQTMFAAFSSKLCQRVHICGQAHEGCDHSVFGGLNWKAFNTD